MKIDFEITFQEALQQKIQLVQKIKSQMAEDTKNDVLKPATIKSFNLAVACFDAAAINFSKPENALHHYSRGCVNLGEFMARQKIDRGK
jgi:hypothetical protein